MAKRIVDTDQWKDPWFRRLPGRHKLAWKFICETADQCGVVRVDTEYWQFMLGVAKMDWEDFFKVIADRSVKLKSGDIWIPQVVRDQCGPLSEACRAHRPVIEFLRREGLLGHPAVIVQKPETERATQVADTLSKPIAKGIQRVSADKKQPTKFTPPTLAEVEQYCIERKNGLDAAAIFDHYQACGWVQGKSRKPIKCWRAAIRTCERMELEHKKTMPPAKRPLMEQVKESLSALTENETNRQPMLVGK